MAEQEILSCVKNEPQNIENLREFMLQTAAPLTGIKYVLLYKYHTIQFGLLEQDHIEIEDIAELTPQYVKEVRVFSENGELHIWKQHHELKYRLRLDGEGDKKVFIYPEEHCMWGNKVSQKDIHLIYEENRGMQFRFPFPVAESRLPLKYEVRNYYTYDYDPITHEGTGLIRFCDARLVRFLDKDDQPLARHEKEA